jgi:hypothetical protein
MVILFAVLDPHNFIRFLPRHEGIDKVFMSYIEQIEKDSKGNIRRIEHMGFDKLPETEKGVYLGLCTRTLLGFTPEIDINVKAWYSLNGKQRYILIAHELTHCYCNVRHKDGVDDVGCPEHFMHPSAPSKACVENNFDKYKGQLKNVCN